MKVGRYMSARLGDWMQTFSGVQFWPLDPIPDEILIEDIAHSLALQCRFAGHTRDFYSVAEHSARVSLECNRKDALWGLLHDAAEAYLVDLIRPIKRASELGELYSCIEDRIMSAVCLRFGLPPEIPASVEQADRRLLMTEARDLLSPPPAPWGFGQGVHVEPFPVKITPVSWQDAERWFLVRFGELKP